MSDKVHRYESESILVTYDAKRCIHAAECVHNLPSVFNPEARPWVSPAAADADEVAAVVRGCPTGALRFERKDGGAEEAPPARSTVRLAADGPLYVHGEITVLDAERNVVGRDTRVAFCRCGASKNKPYCDGAHSAADFADEGAIPDPKIRPGESAGSELRVVLATDGPLILEGPVTLRDAAGSDRCSGTKTALCRCGASANKPFCDGTHSQIDFSA